MSYVYIITNKKNGTLYLGVTNDIHRRIQEHKSGAIKWFSRKYWLDMLVYYEQITNIVDAIIREKQLKNRNRQWKIELIESTNPDWQDLSIYL